MRKRRCLLALSVLLCVPSCSDPKGSDPACGDGVVQSDEVCDGASLGGRTCESEGFTGGTLTCNATCDGLDTTGCTSAPFCGDGMVAGAEVCDGTVLGGRTCESEGFTGGTLACSPTCDALDTSACTGGGPVCGDGMAEGAELCDDTDLAGYTCITEGFTGGTLACNATCDGLDTSGCTGGGPVCGDGVAEGAELCDDTDLAGYTCITEGFIGGTLACNATCDGLDTSGCTSGPLAVTIYQIQDLADPGAVTVGTQVSVADVVVTAVVGAGDSHFFVQTDPSGTDYDPVRGATYSGIYVYRPTGAPLTVVAPGDRLDLEGLTEEFLGCTEILLSAVTVTGNAPAIVPTLVTAADVATGGSTSEAYEGVLVRVESVPVTDQNPDAPSDWGVFEVAGALRVDDTLWTGSSAVGRLPGQSFNFINGPLHWTFGEMSLNPRSAADMDAAIGGLPDVTIYDLRDPSQSNYVAVGAGARLTDVVVTAVVGAGDSHFFVQMDPSSPDYTGAPYSGVYVYRAAGGPTTVLAPGDLVTLEGIHAEYFGRTELQVSSIVVTGMATVPAPTVVMASDVETLGPLAEMYEGVLVRVENVTMYAQNPDSPSDYGVFSVTDGAVVDGLRVDDLLYADAEVEGRPLTNFNYITGILHESTGHKSLNPRDTNDIDGI